MKKTSRIISILLILVLSMTSFSFASDQTVNLQDDGQMVPASSGTLIRMGGNYQLFDGVPSQFQNLTWSEWQTYSAPVTANSVLSVVAGSVGLFKAGFTFWGIITASLLIDDFNQLMGNVFFQNIVDNATVVSGKKTAYVRVFESHAQGGFGSLQYSKLYVVYYKDSTYSTRVGTSNTLCLYAWATGARSSEE